MKHVEGRTNEPRMTRERRQETADMKKKLNSLHGAEADGVTDLLSLLFMMRHPINIRTPLDPPGSASGSAAATPKNKMRVQAGGSGAIIHRIP